MKRPLLFLVLAALLFLPLSLFSACERTPPRSRYTIDAAYENGTLAAEMTVSYYNGTGESLQELWFNLYGNAYREGAAYAPVSPSFAAGAYYEGESYGGMEIGSVSPCAEWDVGGADKNVLRVRLASPVPAGGRCELSVAYTLTLAKVEHRTGIARHSVNLGNFYPVLCVREGGTPRECLYFSNGDPFYSECADYDVTLSVPASFTAAASGAVRSAVLAGGRRVYRFSLENARDFAAVLGGSFRVAQCMAGDTAVQYYYYEDAAPEKTLRLACESLLFFSKRFGAYPYQTYTVVQTGFCYGGMEYPALVYLSDALAQAEAAYTLVHETAHQWWYAVVGSDPVLHAWQDEGLAEYSALLFFEENGQYGFTRAGLLRAAREAYGTFCAVQKQHGEADTSMDRRLDAFGEYEYVVLSYAKGELLFEALRQALGDRRFFAGLRRYYAENAGKLAAPEDLAASFKESAAQAVLGAFRSGGERI